MKRLSLVAVALFGSALVVAGCSMIPGMDGGWTTLIDGTKGLENFNQIGDANWRAEDGAIVADKGKGGYLVSKNSYKDFQIRAEFWADTTTNSGIFLGRRIRRRSAPTLRTRSTSSISGPIPPMAPAPSSTSPRLSRCRRPAASGTPTRSPHAARTSSWC